MLSTVWLSPFVSESLGTVIKKKLGVPWLYPVLEMRAEEPAF